jgi:uncharacterized protein (DUF885 family)
MADDQNNLVLVQLRRLGAQNDQILQAINYTHSQQVADRLLLRSLQSSLDGTNELLTGLTARSARIERRLELSDDPLTSGFSELQHPFDPTRSKR